MTDPDGDQQAGDQQAGNQQAGNAQQPIDPAQPGPQGERIDRDDAGLRRGSDQRALDAGVVRQQVAALARGRENDAFQYEVADLMQRRRAQGEGREDIEQFDLLDGARGGIPVRRGTLLVRSGLRDEDVELYTWLTGLLGEPAELFEGRLLRFTDEKQAPERLVQLARRVRGEGFQASVDHIVPLGPVMKAAGGPSLTELPDDVPPPSVPRHDAVRVAIIDTGVPEPGRGHRWQEPLAQADGSNRDGLDVFPLPDGDTYLDFAAGHGAFAAGIVQQLAPEAALTVLAAADSEGIGSEVRVAQQLLIAVEEVKAEIVNLSLGAQTVDDQPLLALEIAFELMSDKNYGDVLVVAAAGNYGDTRPCWPAASRRVVSVAALTAAGQPAEWSSHGFWVDLSAVGEGIVSTFVRGQESPEVDRSPDTWPADDDTPWALWSGTSFAGPQVVGEVARRLEAMRVAQVAGATPHLALRQLMAEGRHLPDYGVALHILDGT